jgi:hypothetical protein
MTNNEWFELLSYSFPPKLEPTISCGAGIKPKN